MAVKKRARAGAKVATKATVKTPPAEKKWAGNLPSVKPGRYADGIPLHEIEYLACKLMLRPNQLTSRKSLFDFAKVMKEPAAKHDVVFSTDDYIDQPVKIREVLFMDTADFRLYKNAFILRRRIPYKDGFPCGEPEIVFKFRHQDLQTAAETDVRPQIQGGYTLKFKAQALPLKDRLGGIRMLYSHNVQFPRSNVRENDVTSMETIRRVLPALAHIPQRPGERIALVSDTMIEEVLQDIGTLDFGDGVVAKVNVSLWRTRGEHRPLIGEFAYQLKLQDLPKKEARLAAMQRMEEFFISLQFAAKAWIALDATKTGIVYRLKGSPPNAHE